MTTIDWIGSIGVFQMPHAYILNAFGKVKITNLAFILLNLSGTTMACFVLVLLNY